MKLSTPRWWYVRTDQSRRGGMAGIRMLLTPISWIWAAVTARRIAHATPLDVGAPVICVGNLTVGGVGKTPVVRALAERLVAPRAGNGGRAVHLLSRGYGGRLAGPVRVDPQIHTAADVGDEPLMLARDFPVWVARDRAAGALAAAKAGAEVIVMDDGHQNPSVKKALSLVVVDGETRGEDWPFGDGRVFPAGPMREPLATGLARADGVLVLLPDDLPQADAGLVALLKGPPLLTGHLAPAAPPPAGPQVGFAGIGKPWKVERALQAAGCELADFAPFPDHAAYDEVTLKALADRAALFGAGLVTTEKDWVRLPPEWQARVTPWPVRAVFDDLAALDALLAKAGLT
jgi:tetraacyldisaccharide 4'-kinase